MEDFLSCGGPPVFELNCCPYEAEILPGGNVRKSKNCPACGGTEMYFREVSARGSHGPDLLPKVGGFFRGGKFEIYICGSCGHTQLFVPDELLPAVREKYERAW
jgi:ribosomal protein S27AE